MSTELTGVAIVAAARTPIGRFGGSLAGFSAAQLGAELLQGLLERAGLGGDAIDEVILGQVLTAATGQNPARQAAIGAGLPHAVPAMTINKVCGSGLKAVVLATQAIRLGDAERIIAGGQESMSQAPYALPGARTGLRMNHAALIDTMIRDGLWDAFNDYHMGVTAENLVQRDGISREAQDAFAAASQARTAAAQAAGRFADEIVPLQLGDGSLFDADEHPQPDTTAERLAGLRAAFDRAGSVTAGNASGLNDGAAAVVLEPARNGNDARFGRIRAYASAGVDPSIMGIGPVPAIRRCLERAGWALDDLDLLEVNEAFAGQALAVQKALDWDPDRVNVNGGAIALGHPIGASGARILVTLVHEMHRRDARRGLAALCIGGGMGIALAVERP